MIPLDDVFSFSPDQHFDNLIHAEINAALFAHPKDTRKKLLRSDCSVIGFARSQTIVTAATVRLGKFFAKVTQQGYATALAAFGKVNHLPQLGGGDLPLPFVGHLVDEPRVFDRVSGAKEQQAFARQAVSSGAACLLIIAFDVLRQIVMDHKTHVRFVDAHAESDRRTNHAHFVAQEEFLVHGPLFRIEAGMIRLGDNTIVTQALGHALSALAALAIDDAALIRSRIHELKHLFVSLALAHYSIG